MKKLVFFILIFSLTSCVKHIPSEDIYLRYSHHNEGPFIMKMDKGYLDEVNKGKTWIPANEAEQKLKGDSI